MNRNILPILLVLILAISTIAPVLAADTATFEGMDGDKSIGNTGVMDFKNDTSESELNGLCVEKNQFIYEGDSVPVSPGTVGIDHASQVKQLIVENYRENMTKQQGYDLQHAVWFFTDNMLPENQAQKDMINSVLNNPLYIPDSGYKELVGTQTTLVDSKSTETIQLIDTQTNKSEEITQIGQNVFVETITLEDCIKTITTTVTLFNQHISIDIVNTFLKTTTTVDTYKIVKEYLSFDFNKYLSHKKQDLIIFKAIPSFEEIFDPKTTVKTDIFNGTASVENDIPFNTTNVSESCSPIVHPAVNVSAAGGEPAFVKGIGMQTTGAPLLPFAAALAILGSGLVGVYRLRK